MGPSISGDLVMKTWSKSSTSRTYIKRLWARGERLRSPFINIGKVARENPHQRANSFCKMPSRSSNSPTATGLSRTRGAWALRLRDIRSKVEVIHLGQIVAIDGNSGEYVTVNICLTAASVL